MRHTIAHCIFIIFLIGISTPLVAQEPLSRNEEYIMRYALLAQEHQLRYNIPAGITLAQGILESAAGCSRLALEANNHFGIEAHYWEGETVCYGDRTFRKYESVEESFQDHSQFLLSRRYSQLFDLKITDYKGWAKGLKSCGYAEDSEYDKKLINIIECHELNFYTENAERAIQENRVREDIELNREVYRAWGLLYVEAVDGDTYASIAADMGFRAKDLAKYNNDHIDNILHEGDIVYLEKKHRKAVKGYETHIVREGETFHSISQLYGVDCKRLARRNKMRYNSTIETGIVLILR